MSALTVQTSLEILGAAFACLVAVALLVNGYVARRRDNAEKTAWAHGFVAFTNSERSAAFQDMTGPARLSSEPD